MPPQRYSPMFIALIVAIIIMIRWIARSYTLPDALASSADANLLRDGFQWNEGWKGGSLFRSIPILGSDGLLENSDGTPYMG